MSSLSNICAQLRNTTKGRLTYDTTWHRDGRTKKILEECTSPPKLTSTKISTSPQNEFDHDHGNTSDDYHHDHHKGLTHEEAVENAKNRHDPRRDSGVWRGAVVDHLELCSLDEEESTVNEDDDNALNCSDFERHLIITSRTQQEEDEEYRKVALVNLEEKSKLYQSHSQMLERQAREHCSYVCKSIEKNVWHGSQLREQAIKQGYDDTNQKQQKQLEKLKQSAKALNNKFVEAQQRKREEEEKERQRQQALRDQVTRLEDALKEFLKVKAMVTKTIESCKNLTTLHESIRKYPEVLDNLSGQVEGLLADVQKKKSCNTEILTAHLTKANQVLEYVRKQCDKAEEVVAKEREERQKIEEEKLKQQQLVEEKQRQQQEAEKLKQEQQQKTQQPQQPADVPDSQASSQTSSKGGSSSLIQMNSVFEDTLAYYDTVMDKLKEIEKKCESLASEPQLKKVKFDLHKAINTPINAISSQSGRHLRDKLDKITSLLKGNTVTVGGKPVCAQHAPAGVDFCLNTFAKKMVSQGDTQVLSQHEAAFPLAAAMVGVWCEVPAVGDLLLAHFYLKCPYLAPYYIPLKEGQSSDSYYKALGYQTVDGAQEKQDMFLKRMSGLMRLYAAIFVSVPPRPGVPHPHGLDKAWAWITRVITLDPRPDITATLLHDFLEVTAHTLAQNYRRQFRKLMDYLIRDYMPRICDTAGSGGPVSRLKVYLEKIARGGTSAPKGQLSAGFWST